MPQLSFAELIDRDVPLAAGEAVALTLTAAAVADATAPGQQLPTLDQIFLSSTGDVTILWPPAESGLTEGAWLTSLLCGLLRLDEPEHRARCRGRVPGGLLVLVARMRGQIDLPPLPEGALRSSLTRFSARAEPALLAAIFWRAARVRSRQTDTHVPSGASVDRRSRGPSASELRKWLREAEYELFALKRRRSIQPMQLIRRAAVGLGRAAAVVALAAVAIGVGFWLSSARLTAVDPPLPGDLVVLDTLPSAAPLPIAISSLAPQRFAAPGLDMSSRITEPRPQAKAAQKAKIRRKPTQRAPVAAASTRSERPVRTVRLVNLPRASWAVVEESSSAARKEH